MCFSEDRSSEIQNVLGINVNNGNISAIVKKYFKGLCIRRLLVSTVWLMITAVMLLLLPLNLEKPQVGMPFYTTFMEQRGQGVTYSSSWLDLESLPPYLICSIVKGEDRYFFNHFGFDVGAIYRSIVANLTRGKVYGGSTITQQLAKNLFGRTERGILTKLIEAWYAIKLEIFYTKDEILEFYINSIELGDGVWGVENASRFYFNKPASELKIVESILLSTYIASPLQFNNPIQQTRMKNIFHRINYQLLISDNYDRSVYENIKKTALEFSILPPKEMSELSHNYLYFERRNCGIEKELQYEKK